MKILITGCSWSAGITEQPYSWPQVLADENKEHEWYNLSYAGSSIEHNLKILEQAQNYMQFDLTIFQVTLPARKTIYAKEFDVKDQVLQRGNYFYLDKRQSEIINFNPGTVEWFKQKHFLKKYYNEGKQFFANLNLEEQIGRHIKLIKECIIPKCDLVFFHKTTEVSKQLPLLVVEEEMGPAKFNSFCIDDGHHFSEKGVREQAKLLKKHLTTLTNESII